MLRLYLCGASAVIIVLIRGSTWLPPHTFSSDTPKRRLAMGEKGSKKDRNKADKQKKTQIEKKKEQQKTKLPAKKPE
jgi:hypothetical protein